ncbi:MAG: DUF2062 domain-containing protein [Desulfobacterales bacterium]|nr:DUF2062 domain-containing protein [Desulfobacterales bacterium]
MFRKFNQKIKEVISKFKQLQGDPRYVARGVAIGVFIGITPTLPFHTVIALALSFLFKGSKAAAALGVWIGNPLTLPFCYWGSYYAGSFFLPVSMPPEFNLKYESITELARLGLDATLSMLLGGVIIGVLPGIASYFLTCKIIGAMRMKQDRLQPSTNPGGPGKP